MANALIRNPADWVNGKPIAQSELSALDLALSRVVNGEGGGTYTQGGGITTIAGAGVWLAASADHAFVGGGTLVYSPSGEPITHADNDYTTLSPSHSGTVRQVITGCARAGTAGGWVQDGASRNSLLSTRMGAEFVLPLRVVDGARLAYAELHFFFTTGHEATPARPVRGRLLRIDANGVATPMTTNTTDGFVPYTAAIGLGFTFDANTLRTLTIPCDTANVIDVGSYSYVADIIEESGQYAVGGNIFADVRCAHADIADTRPQ